MAVVYRARDHRLGGREVAIKLLHPHLSARDDSLVRFKNEADAAAKLEHDNILKIFDAGVGDEEEAFIVMEFVRGQTLAAIIEDSPFTLVEMGAMVAHEVARALVVAHRERILHRDVKPENVMIREDGLVKLMDFGIARALDNHGMTMTGALMGSPAHMAPEQIEGKELDFRADVFSLGTLLYFGVTGVLPFTGPSPHSLLQKILSGDYDSARMVSPLVGKTLSQIIDKALARAPEDRYQSAGDLQKALADYLKEFEIQDPSRELRNWILDPGKYQEALRIRVVNSLVNRAKESVDRKKRARAIDDLNRVLAMDSNNQDAKVLLDDLNVAGRRGARVRRGFILAATAALTFGLLTVGMKLIEDPDPVVLPGAVIADIGETTEVPSTADEGDELEILAASPAEDEGATEKPVAQEEARVDASSESGDASAEADIVEEEDTAPEIESAASIEVASAAVAGKRDKDTKKTTSSAKTGKENGKTSPGESEKNTKAEKPGKKNENSDIAARLFPILIKIVPPAATLTLDGKPRPEFSTGPKTLKLRSGKHTFRLEAPSCPLCASVSSSFVIDPASPIRERTFQIGLKPATLQIDAEPKARVWLDNRAKGRTGKPIRVDIPFKDRMAGKEVSVRLASTGYREKTFRIRLKPGQVRQEIIQLVPEVPEEE